MNFVIYWLNFTCGDQYLNEDILSPRLEKKMVLILDEFCRKKIGYPKRWWTGSGGVEPDNLISNFR